MTVLNNVIAPEEYNELAELLCEGSRTQKIIIGNNAIYLQMAEQRGSGKIGRAVAFGHEMYLPPGIYDFARPIERIRFKRAQPAEPFPQVTLLTNP